MKNSIKKLVTNKFLQWALLVILIAYQMIRLVIFVDVYGGLDHDSGWFLGVARSLAEKGTYTTMVSTMSDPTLAAGLDVQHQFFQVQAEDGGVYFFIEGTTGPTQIIPDAIVIKLLGSGFWQFRVASLLFYLMFLILGSWLLFSIDGFLAPLMFHAFLFLYPHLSVFLGYESLGEVPLIVCLLLTFTLYAKAIVADSKRPFWFFLSGLVAGLAIITKLVALLPLGGLGMVWLILYLKKRITTKDTFIFASGGLLPPAGWELTQLIIISRLFGFDNYIRHTQQRLNFFLTQGSGLSIQGSAKFFWYKLLLISEISHPDKYLSLISFAVIGASGIFLIWRFRNTPVYQYFLALLWSSWLTYTLWFIVSSESGGVRRYWQALILGVLLLSLFWSNLLNMAKTSRSWYNLLIALTITVLIGINFYSQRQAATLFLSKAMVEKWHEKRLSFEDVSLPWMIVPRQEQEAALKIIQRLPASAHVFYPESHKSAEMAVLSGRILYPLERRALMSPSADDVVLIGPSLISPWRKPTEAHISRAEQQAFISEVLQQIKRDCPHIIFENSYYIICAPS